MSTTLPSRVGDIRERAVVIPGLVAVAVTCCWGADLAIRGDLSSGQFVWLLIVAAVLALLSLPLLVPLTLLLDGLAAPVARVGRIAIYVAVFGAIGATVGLATNAISLAAAVFAGGLTGFLIAVVCRSPHAR